MKLSAVAVLIAAAILGGCYSTPNKQVFFPVAAISHEGKTGLLEMPYVHKHQPEVVGIMLRQTGAYPEAHIIEANPMVDMAIGYEVFPLPNIFYLGVVKLGVEPPLAEVGAAKTGVFFSLGFKWLFATSLNTKDGFNLKLLGKDLIGHYH